MMASVPRPSASADGLKLAKWAARSFDAGQELAGDGGGAEAEEVLDLGGGDEDGDAVGEADDDRAGDEADRGAEAGEAHEEENHAGHEGDHGRPLMPKRATMPATMTTKAPVGPPIWVREPPRAEMRKPATTAV